MLHLNSRLCAVIAVGLSLLAVPGLQAQSASEAPAAIRGDVDGDGRVTRADADAVRAFLVRGTVPAGRSILPAGDANGDGRVTAADAALISRFAAGVDVSRFPVGRPVGAGQTGPGGGGTLQTGDQFCTVDVKAETVTCREVLAGGGAAANVILGTPFVTFVMTSAHSRGNSVDEDTTSYTVAVRNATPQPLGTTDGTTLAADGIRLFFSTAPVVTLVSSGTNAGASLRLETPDGTATFTNQNGSSTYTNRMYFQYNEVLAPADTSAARSMQFIYSSNVTSFSFGFRVSAPAQYEHGWITISPASTPILSPGQTATLTGKVYNQVGQEQADGITWSSSDPAVATVSASGEVTAVAEGTATITATSTVNAQRKGTRVITVDVAPTVVSTTPANAAVGVLPGDNIVVNFSEPVDVTASSFSLECPAGSTQAFTLSGSGTSAITLNPDADLPAASTCTVTVVAANVSDSDANDGPNLLAADYVFSFEVAIQANNDALADIVTGNVRFNTAPSAFSVTTNDKITPATTITFAGWDGNPGVTMAGGNVVMDTEGDSLGQFTYNPPAGFEGVDSLAYTIQSGSSTSSAKVAITVGGAAGMIWFVKKGSASCGAQCGRLTDPYPTLEAFRIANTGAVNKPGDGDAVFVFESATPDTVTAPVTLLPNQKLIGQDASSDLATISGITPAAGSDALPPPNPTVATVTIAGAAGGVVLGANNLVRGFGISTTGGSALAGTNFGTPTIEQVTLSATNGPALTLDNGTLNTSFPTLSSTTSAGRGVSLTNVSGTITFGSGVQITNSTGSSFYLNGGAPTVTYSGGIAKGGAFPGRLVEIVGTTGGAVTFDTGTLIANSTNGLSTGILLSNVKSAVNFNGTTTLSGGDAGVDVEGGTTAAITFTSGTTITNPSGVALFVDASAPSNLTFAGNISTNAGRPVQIEDLTGGSITVSGSVTSTSQGIWVRNNTSGSPSITFNGARTLTTGANHAVDLDNNDAATISFGTAAMTIGTTSGEGFRVVNGGSVNVTGTANDVTSTTGVAVRIADSNVGSNGVRFRAVSNNGAANGIFLSNTGATGGSFRVDGTGAVGSGGSILGSAGGDGTTSGNGVYMNNVRNVVLSSMIINNSANHGIFGQTVSGFTLDNSRLAGTHGTNVGFDEAAVSISELTGVALFTNDSVSGGVEDNVRILNTTGTLDSLVFNNVRVGHMHATQGNDAMLIRVQDAAVVKARIRNSTFHGARGDMLQFNVVNSGNGEIVMTGNTFHNTHANIVSGVGGITLSGGGSGSTPRMRYTITGNSFRGSRGTMLVISKGVGTADYAGTVESNTFGQSGIGAGSNNTSSSEGSAVNFVLYGGGTHTTRVHNNQMYGYNNYGVLMEVGDFSGGGGGHGTLNATITNNTIAEPGSFAFPQQGIHLNVGLIENDAHTACVNITGNSMNDAGDSQDVRLRQRMKTTIKLPGYPGTTTDNTAVNNFVKANNGNAATLVVAATNSVALGAPDGPGNGFVAGACPVP